MAFDLEVHDGRLCLTRLDVGGRALLHHDGAPLVGPWFGRLPSPTAHFDGRPFDVSRGPCDTDEVGRPLHGFRSTADGWSVRNRPGRADATGSWFHPHAFPFPHQVHVTVAVADGGVEVTTVLEPHGGPVPACYGWHPYLASGPDHAVDVRLGHELGLSGSLPDGTTTGRHGPATLSGPLDSYWDAADGGTVRLDGPGTTVHLVRGWRHAVLWAPEDATFTCVEPLAGPLDPFSGRCPTARPGAPTESVYTITG